MLQNEYPLYERFTQVQSVYNHFITKYPSVRFSRRGLEDAVFNGHNTTVTQLGTHYYWHLVVQGHDYLLGGQTVASSIGSHQRHFTIIQAVKDEIDAFVVMMM